MKGKIMLGDMSFDCDLKLLKVKHQYNCSIPKRKHSIANVNRVAVLSTSGNQKQLKKTQWKCVKDMYQRQKGGK